MNNIDPKLQKAYMAVVLIEAYSNFYPAGNNLHVLLADGNYDTAGACLDWAKEKNDLFGIKICELLLEFTEEEIEQICQAPWEITEKITNLIENKNTSQE